MDSYELIDRTIRETVTGGTVVWFWLFILTNVKRAVRWKWMDVSEFWMALVDVAYCF